MYSVSGCVLQSIIKCEQKLKYKKATISHTHEMSSSNMNMNKHNTITRVPKNMYPVRTEHMRTLSAVAGVLHCTRLST